MRASALLEPEPQCIPRAADETRRGHRVERDERVLADLLALERDAQRADALTLRDRRDERLLREQFGFELVGLALRHGEHEVAREAGLHVARRALPDLERLHFLV